MDAAARQFSEAYDAGQHPMEFVNAMRKKGELIMGIGHRVKSINNPDMRVCIIKVNRVLPFLFLFLLGEVEVGADCQVSENRYHRFIVFAFFIFIILK